MITPANNLDWTLLFHAFEDALEWAFDVAQGFAREFPAEVDAVERVRAFTRRQNSGRAGQLHINDLLFTFALVAGALERDVGFIATPSQFQVRFAQPGARAQRAT